MSFYFDFVLSNWQSDIIHYFLTSPLFLIAGIYSTTNLKTYEQEKIYLTQQTHSLHLKNKKRHTFIGMCSLIFTWFTMQILNLCHS